jgi:hypothetical protein
MRRSHERDGRFQSAPKPATVILEETGCEVPGRKPVEGVNVGRASSVEREPG